jgi:hypothetical protein
MINNKFKSRLLQLLGLNSNLIQNGSLQNEPNHLDRPLFSNVRKGQLAVTSHVYKMSKEPANLVDSLKKQSQEYWALCIKGS